MAGKVAVIGGITIDVEGKPDLDLQYQDSNPGEIRISYGGVGRNITENLGRLGVPVTFISRIGDDFMGLSIKEALAELSVDVEHIKVIKGKSTAMYLSILNILGDMELGICNMDVLDQISKEDIEDLVPLLKGMDMVLLDTNLSEEVLEYATERLKEVPLFLDPVSVVKAVKAKDLIGRFHTIKPNRAEAEAIYGKSILSEEDLKEAGDWFINQGVKRVFISLSMGGVYYQEGKEKGIIEPKSSEIASATGAGDAFSAAAILGFLNKYDVRKTAEIAMRASRLSLETKVPVNPELTLDKLLEEV